MTGASARRARGEPSRETLPDCAPRSPPASSDASLASPHNRAPPLAPRRWRALSAAGLGDPAAAYVITNAACYKAFEFWAFGRGLALPHVINSGRSVGDAR